MSQRAFSFDSPSPWFNRAKHFAAQLTVAAGLVGCASVPMGDPQQDAALKAFAVAPDRAGIFVYRNEAAAVAVTMDVHLDGVPLGQTAPKTYLYRQVAPGRHTVTSQAENTDTLDVDVEAGALAFVWQEIKWGMFSTRSKLHLMNETQGRKGVLETRLAEGKSPMQAVEVRVEADDPAWSGPLDCRVSNSFGSWPFAAPGTVSVAASTSPLRITCRLPAGAASESGATVESAVTASQGAARSGTRTGATVGAIAGVALGAAAAPVMGPAFAALLALGSVLKGAEIGGIVGAVSAGDVVAYPSPIVVRFERAASPD
jgi:hypothetical protein